MGFDDEQVNVMNQAVLDYRAVRREMGVTDRRDDEAAYRAKGMVEILKRQCPSILRI